MLRGSTNTTATSARCAPERALSGTGAELLQGAAAGMLASANVIGLRTRVGFAAVVHGEVNDAEIDADSIISADHEASSALHVTASSGDRCNSAV
jgi:hypothetical protein